MTSIGCLLLLLLMVSRVSAQLTIGNGATIAASDGTDIVAAIKGNISNGSTYDFSNAKLRVALQSNNAAQTMSGNFVVASRIETPMSNSSVG